MEEKKVTVANNKPVKRTSGFSVGIGLYLLLVLVVGFILGYFVGSYYGLSMGEVISSKLIA